MRRIADQLQALPGTPFVLIIGVVAGTIEGLPRLLLGGTSAPLRVVPVLIVGGATLLWWLAALVLWWIAVRRRASIWVVAMQVTLGLVIADLVAYAMDTVGLPSELAAALIQHAPMVLSSNLTLALLRAPLWFVGSVLALAIGRRLAGGVQPPPASPTAATHPDAAT